MNDNTIPPLPSHCHRQPQPPPLSSDSGGKARKVEGQAPQDVYRATTPARQHPPPQSCVQAAAAMGAQQSRPGSVVAEERGVGGGSVRADGAPQQLEGAGEFLKDPFHTSFHLMDICFQSVVLCCLSCLKGGGGFGVESF